MTIYLCGPINGCTDSSREAVDALAVKLERLHKLVYTQTVADEAAATLRALSGERDEYRDRAHNAERAQIEHNMKYGRCGETQAELERVKGALHKYGSHYAMCLIDSDDAICSCGLETALGEKP